MENIVYSNITVHEIVEVSKMCHETDITPVFIGESGIGKTERVTEYAKMKKYDLQVLNCSTLFVEDFGAVRDSGDWIQFKLNKIFDVNKETIFFIDEFSRALRSDLRNGIMSMVNERQLYGVALSNKIRFIVAMNPPSEDYGDADDPFTDLATVRRYSLFNVKVNVEDWLRWASKNDVGKETMAFISKNQIALMSGQACPRQWVKMDNVLKKHKISGIKRFAPGTIGAVGRSFLEYLTNEKVINIDDVLRNYRSVQKQVKQDKALQIALSSELKRKTLTNKHKKNLIMFFIDLPEEIRYKAILDLTEGENEELIFSIVENNEALKEFMEKQSNY